MTKVIEVIDVDQLSDSSSDDPEIVFTGFKRDASKSKVHTDLFDSEGLVYTGFSEPAKPLPYYKSIGSGEPLRRASHTSSQTPEADRPPLTTIVQRTTIGSTVASRHENSGTSSGQPTKNHVPLGPIVESTKRPPSIPNGGPPVKRQKRTHVPSTTNPQLKREHAAMQSGSHYARVAPEVICISDSEDEEPAPKVMPNLTFYYLRWTS
ncbi:hypothetical protein BN946_scf184977.g42 [Trametes cinnabarina]|uniref:Uncharacterized protein n=1 Tax=Pycnoporus cinnabarinus TaxID=5643 RepID=A0A060SDC8_PYCCI|nr:hypothetical protein BN946_scf184977.g42 [Trametes cinnabarina]